MKKLALFLVVLLGLFAGGYFCLPVIVRGFQVWHMGSCYDTGNLVTAIEIDTDSNIKERAWDRLLVVYNEHSETYSWDMTRVIFSDKAPEKYRNLAWKTIESRIRGNVGKDAIMFLNWGKKRDYRTDIAWEAYGSKLSVAELREMFLTYFSPAMVVGESLFGPYAAEELALRDVNVLSGAIRKTVCDGESLRGITIWVPSFEIVWGKYKDQVTDKDLAIVAKYSNKFGKDAEQILAKRKADREAAKQAAKKPKLGLAVREDDARLR